MEGLFFHIVNIWGTSITFSNVFVRGVTVFGKISNRTVRHALAPWFISNLMMHSQGSTEMTKKKHCILSASRPLDGAETRLNMHDTQRPFSKTFTFKTFQNFAFSGTQYVNEQPKQIQSFLVKNGAL